MTAYDWTALSAQDEARASRKRMTDAVSAWLGTTGINTLDADTLIEAMVTETATTIKNAINSLRSFLADGMLTIGTLLIYSTPEQFKTTTTLVYKIAGAIYTKAATNAIAFSASMGTINTAAASGTAHWGAYLVQIDSAGTFSTLHGTYSSGTDQDYATEALAIAALPAPSANKVQVGYITVQVKTGGRAWTPITDDLTPTSDCTTANFYDLPTPSTLPAAI